MGVARSTYYGAPPANRDAESLSLIEAICEEFEAYGYRRVTAELRHQGHLVNSKRVRRLMREHGLSPKQRRRYVTTTDSDHDEPIFPILAAEMAPDGPNQLWVADITYVAIATGFVYLAAILDAWSRRVVGYAISRSIDARLTIAALDAAVRSRAPPAGCVHHSDRGSQGGFKRSSQRLTEEVAMRIRKRRSDRSGRAPLLSSGRPPVATRDQRRRFWAAIAAGLVSEEAAIKAGVSQAVGTRWFRKAGGMPPAMFGLSAKPLSGRYLSLGEREEIALLRVQGRSMQEIARRLGRAASTVSRELRRNAATRSGGLDYRATTAQWHAERSARRPKQTKLVLNAALRIYVEERLAGVVVASNGASVPGPAVSWKGRRHGPRQDRRWARAWRRCGPLMGKSDGCEPTDKPCLRPEWTVQN